MKTIVCFLLAIQAYGSMGKAITDPSNYMSLLAVSNNINQFSMQLYEQLSKEQNGNFISSPISASMVLSMLLYGARGDTETKLKEALNTFKDSNVQKAGMKTLVENFNDFSKVDLKLANRIFIADNVSPKPEFRQITEDVFKSPVQNVDFKKADDTSKLINDWAEKQTNSKIKNLVTPDALTGDTSMVLVNAVYFKGNWATKFNKNYTVDLPFYLENGTAKEVPMMHAFGDYRYGELPEFKAKFVELPYESTDISDAISMFIVVPDDVSGLKELEENLSKLPLSRLLTGLFGDVNLFVPKFKIESEIDFKTPLSNIGLSNIFGNSADFSGIIDDMPLKVSKVVQKAFIEVNEEGSEAAAATSIQIVTFSSAHEPYEFHVNRPFYYAIVKRLNEKDNGVVLFHGHYKN